MPLDKTSVLKEPASLLWKDGETPDVYVDIYGITHVTWIGETSTPTKRVFYIFDDGNLNFDTSNTTLIGNIDRACRNPKIAVNRSGRVLIIYEVQRADLAGWDVYLSSNDGLNSLAVSEHISRNSAAGRVNRNPKIVINDDTKDPHFVWLGTHSVSGSLIPYYTKKNGTLLIPTIHEVTPDLTHDCDNIDVGLYGHTNQVFIVYEQANDTTGNTNVRLSQGDDTGFALLGQFDDTLSLKILNKPDDTLNNKYPRISVSPRIYDIVQPPTSDDDPALAIVWEDDDEPNHVQYVQRLESDFSNGIIATSGVHRPVVRINHQGSAIAAYYKATGANNIVNLAFKELTNNQWTAVDDIANEHAYGDGLFNIELLISGDDHIYIAFRTGAALGPQRIIHLNNFRTGSPWSFEIFAEELNSASITRSPVSMHIDDKIGNRFLASDSPSRAAIVFSDFTSDVLEPDGIGDVYVFGGVVHAKPFMVTVEDPDGDNKPDFTWFVPGEESQGFFDIYYRLCGASGIVPYEQDVFLTGTFVSGIEGGPSGAGYLFTYEGASGIDVPDLYGFGVRKREGPWSDELCIDIGISVSNPTIIPPNNQTDVEKCEIVTLGGSAEPGSSITSQSLIEYSDVAGTIPINITPISAYTINPQGIYSGTLPLSLLPNTASIRTEVIALDVDGNLSIPADSRSNLLVVTNLPPNFISIELRDQTTCAIQATNSQTINVITSVSGDVFEIKLWESILAGGTGEAGATWIPYASSIPFTLANNTNETKTVFAKLRDSCGNESVIKFDSIELDTVPPQLLSATFDPATRRLTLTFNEPVTRIDPSKIRIVKG